MDNASLIKKAIRSWGFKQIGRFKLYRIENDILFYLLVESGYSILTSYGFKPLFVPPPAEFLTLEFSERVLYRFHDLPYISKKTDPAVIDEFCVKLEQLYHSQLQPFFSEYSTAEKLMEWANRSLISRDKDDYLPLTIDLDWRRILMYGNAYLGNYAEAVKEASTYIDFLNTKYRYRYTADVLQNWIGEANDLIDLVTKADPSGIQARFQEWREQSFRVFGIKA